jgi:hypothetical protein
MLSTRRTDVINTPPLINNIDNTTNISDMSNIKSGILDNIITDFGKHTNNTGVYENINKFKDIFITTDNAQDHPDTRIKIDITNVTIKTKDNAIIVLDRDNAFCEITPWYILKYISHQYVDSESIQPPVDTEYNKALHIINHMFFRISKHDAKVSFDFNKTMNSPFTNNVNNLVSIHTILYNYDCHKLNIDMNTFKTPKLRNKSEHAYKYLLFVLSSYIIDKISTLSNKVIETERTELVKISAVIVYRMTKFSEYLINSTNNQISILSKGIRECNMLRDVLINKCDQLNNSVNAVSNGSINHYTDQSSDLSDGK